MADGTKIEWTDATWNPVTGCSPVSVGCVNCYAARMAYRLECMGHERYIGLTELHCNGVRRFNGTVRCHDGLLEQPLRWRKPRRIFVCSMSDLFHPNVPDDFIHQVFTQMRISDRHTFQILTKRPERAAQLLARALPNVWLGTTIEDQATADQRGPILRRCRAVVRFISAEPLLEQTDLCLSPGMEVSGQEGIDRGIHWVIVGETGPGARHMDLDWARSIRDQCRAAGVPFFFKRASGSEPTPDDLMIREFPKVVRDAPSA
jgi:protein gp37